VASLPGVPEQADDAEASALEPGERPAFVEAHARLLYDAARQLGETLDPERVYERFHELLGDAVSHDGIVVSSYDADENLIRCDYAWVDGNRIDPSTLPPLEPAPDGQGLQSRAIYTGESMIVNDIGALVQSGHGTYYTVDREGNVRKVPEAGEAPTRAAILAPVKLAGRVVGVVQVMSDHVAYTADQLALVDALVGQMAAAVRNAKLYKQAQEELEARKRAEERALHLQRATAALGRALDPRDVVAVLLEEAEAATAASAVVVGLGDPAVTEPELITRSPLQVPGPIPGAEALVGRDPLWFSSEEDFDRAFPGSAEARRAHGWRSLALLPLVVDGRVAGFLELGFAEPEAFEEVSRAALLALVEQCAQALERVTAQEERRRLAATQEAATAIAREREQAARVLAAMGDGVALVDESGVVRLWNPAAEQITGVRAVAVVGRPIAEALPGWDAVYERDAPVDAARADTVPIEVGGRELWLSVSAVHSPDGVVFAFRDLTSERQLEQAKTDFVATVSHELRTPLTAVYGAARTLLRTDLEFDPDQRRTLLEMIADQAQRLSDIADEVLLASRLDAGDLPLAREPLDAGRIVAETVEAMRSRLDEGSSLRLEVAPELPSVSGDGDRLRQILVNLIDNAIKYSPEGSPVSVSVERRERRVRVSVSDRGAGIPRAEHARVFERFYRVDPQHARAPSGTGLGLYISRELAERMGGSIGLVSDEGEGSTFFVELPVAADAVVA
jgi:PAS domain S-box-containing protein